MLSGNSIFHPCWDESVGMVRAMPMHGGPGILDDVPTVRAFIKEHAGIWFVVDIDEPDTEPVSLPDCCWY